MATSSITHNFIVSDSKRFAEALEVVEQEAVNRVPHKPVHVHNVTDALEIRSFWNKVNKKTWNIKELISLIY